MEFITLPRFPISISPPSPSRSWQRSHRASCLLPSVKSPRTPPGLILLSILFLPLLAAELRGFPQGKRVPKCAHHGAAPNDGHDGVAGVCARKRRRIRRSRRRDGDWKRVGKADSWYTETDVMYTTSVIREGRVNRVLVPCRSCGGEHPWIKTNYDGRISATLEPVLV